jgi:hypothetical protein
MASGGALMGEQGFAVSLYVPFSRFLQFYVVLFSLLPDRNKCPLMLVLMRGQVHDAD